MTSDEIKKVREAAEDMMNHGSNDCDNSQLIVTNFAISLVGTDGECPVTEELVESYGFEYSDDEDAWCIDVDDMKYEMHKHRNNVWSLYWDETESWPHDIHCCYQFRLLAAALGIKRKGES